MGFLSVLNMLPDLVWSPLIFAALLILATALLSLAPWQARRAVSRRLDGYVAVEQAVEVEERKPFVQRVLRPLLRRTLHNSGHLVGGGQIETTVRLLTQAGNPSGMTVVDFTGLRLLAALALGGAVVLALSLVTPLSLLSVLIALPVGGVGAVLPVFWLGHRTKQRKKLILKALPDALDMLTIGVEAGLAFESSLQRVGERWDNPLTYEFRQAVTEMRLGTPRGVALTRITERTDVQELRTFIAILVQANQLGLSIADVLHVQAEQMRTKRRQWAEEKAAQAGIKMLLPLVFLIFPNVMIVTLGPLIPVFIEVFGHVSGSL